MWVTEITVQMKTDHCCCSHHFLLKILSRDKMVWFQAQEKDSDRLNKSGESILLLQRLKMLSEVHLKTD